MPYQQARLVGFGVKPVPEYDNKDEHLSFVVLGLWYYRGKASTPQVVRYYKTWEAANAMKELLEVNPFA